MSTELDDFDVAELDRALHEAIAPIDEQIKKLDQLIFARENELSKLREHRRRVKSVRTALTPPDERAASKNGASARATSARHSASRAAKKKRVEEFIRRHRVDQDISAGDLDGQLGDPPISRGLLYELLRELHDEGVLRLDRLAIGNASIYRLVQ